MSLPLRGKEEARERARELCGLGCAMREGFRSWVMVVGEDACIGEEDHGSAGTCEPVCRQLCSTFASSCRPSRPQYVIAAERVSPVMDQCIAQSPNSGDQAACGCRMCEVETESTYLKKSGQSFLARR